VVRIEMWVEEIRPSRFTIGYELFDDGKVASRARSVCVPFDLAQQRPRRVNDAERAFLTEWLVGSA
jgi:acyl-CoA thioester hydrolase